MIETARLTLRRPTRDDAAVAGLLLSDPEVMRFLGGHVVPPEHHGAVVAKWLDRWEANGMGAFMVERRADGAFLGRAGILVWDTTSWTHTTLGDEHAQPELGWAFARAHWGNGYATEAAAAVRDWARGERGVGRLISLIAPANLASQRVAARLGARPGETVTLFDSGPAVVWDYP